MRQGEFESGDQGGSLALVGRLAQHLRSGGRRLLDVACTWRGVRIPEDPAKAATFIWWMLTNGIFSQMTACDMTPNLADPHPDELGPDGVAKFWELVASL